MSEEEVAVGFSFGNSNAVVAVYKDGKTDVLANHLGERTTPTVVAFVNNELVVGLPAKNSIVRNARLTLIWFYRLLSAKTADIENDNTWKGFCRPSDKDGQPVFRLEQEDEKILEITPQDAVAHVCRELKSTACQAGSVDSAVFAVPYTFTVEQRTALRAAASAAGLKVPRLVHEHVAALLAYNIANETRGTPGYYVVVDVGGTQSSVSVVALRNGMFTTLSHVCDPKLGGKDIDTAIVDQVAQEFKRKSKLDVREDARAMAKLLAAAEAAKKTLSSRTTANVSVESLYEGVDCQCEVARARLEVSCSNVFKRVTDLVTAALEQASVRSADVAKVVLGGGTCRFPPVKTALQRVFDPQIIDDTIAADEVYALGASRVSQSDIEEQEGGRPVQLAATSADVGLRKDDGSFVTLIPRSTPLPVRQKCVITTVEDGQTSVAVDICERGAGDAITQLARLAFKKLAETAQGLTRIDLTLHIDKHNALHIHATEPASNQSVNTVVAAS